MRTASRPMDRVRGHCAPGQKVHRRTSSCQWACRTDAPGSALPRKTSAARNAQDHPATELEPHLISRSIRRDSTDIDKRGRNLGRCPRLRLAALAVTLQPRPPPLKYCPVDAFRPAKLQHRHPARLVPRKQLPPHRLASPDPLDSFHRSLRCKTDESLSGPQHGKEVRRGLTAYSWTDCRLRCNAIFERR